MDLTHRERFNRLFCGQPVDRAPFIDVMGKCNFPSCITRWKSEGLDQNADNARIREMMGFDYERGYFLEVKTLFWPEFDIEFIRREGDKTFYRNKWGGLEIQKDGSEVMPITLEGPVKDRRTWDSVKERLCGDVTARLPADIDAICAEAGQSGLPVYTGDLPAGFFGAPREICGFENLALMFYEDPELLSEILDTLCDLWISLYLELQKRVTLDYIFVWEDMCNKNGPLISPASFREFLLPRYKRLTSVLREAGCKNFFVDSDGDDRPLVPLWLEGGVNIVFPWESRYGLDVIEVRKAYPTMGMIGGINKHALEYTYSDIDAELKKVPYMLENGYFIPGCDHGVTNQVPWSNYCYFYEKLRELVYKYPPQI